MDPQQNQQQFQQNQQSQQQVPQQFQQTYQQSFFSQPALDPQQQVQLEQQYQQNLNTVPANTNSNGNGQLGFYVGGVGVPGAQVELLPESGQLDSVEHASASRAPVGPFDPPAGSTPMMPSTTTTTTTTPMIQLQRENSTTGQIQTTPVEGQRSQGQTVTYAPDTNLGNNNSTAAPTTYSSTTTTSYTTAATGASEPIVHIASEGAVAAAAAANAADEQNRGRRRSSIAVLADKFRSSISRSRSRGGDNDERSPSLTRRLSRTLSRNSLDGGNDERRASGPYADVKIAQQEYMAKIRAEQERNNITTNADGLPIPPPAERQRRRSSVSHVLGLDKPLLSR
ncbi:hypothetical protein BGZ94_000096 [Podila epigama]|nr:hypothetical protein BGZ94_000096 [Podila epigama]